MKFLFAVPRFERDTNPPLGVAYLAASLRQAGFPVDILDPTFGGESYAKKELGRRKFDVFGVSAYTKNYESGLELARLARAHNPKCRIVFGGVHPTILGDEVIQEPLVDIVVLGEAEETIVDLAVALSKGKPLSEVKGIIYKENGRPRTTAPRSLIRDLDKIPFPARDLLPMREYLNANYGRAAWSVKQPATSVITSRGCPYRCTYCSSHLMFGRTVRFRSPENIVGEIRALIRDYGIRGLTFVDDTFTLKADRIEGLHALLKKESIRIEWICNGRVDTVTKDMLRTMKKSGCEVIAFGVESGNQRILDDILHKNLKLARVREVFRWCRELKIKTDAYFMIGIPGETLQDIRNTIRFAKEIRADAVNFSITSPMPKTELYDIAQKHGKIIAEKYSDFDYAKKSVFVSDTLDPETIEKWKRYANRSFYFDPRYVLRQLLSIRGTGDIIKKLKGFLMVLDRQ
ncbi:MAG: radical SAM protein [archaeon]